MGLAYRLTFILPPALGLVPAGRHQPCLHGCVLDVSGRDIAGDVRAPLVTVTGLSREQVFEQARRFLKVHGKGCGPMAFSANLTSPCGHIDKWAVSLNSGVTFAPTALGADVDPPPLLRGLIIPLPVR